jgi:voltage-gated potassium channel
MFALSLAFLVCQAVLVVIWVDVPNFSENAAIALDPDIPQDSVVRASLGGELVDHRIQRVAIALMLAVWPIVILESLFHWLSRPWDAATRRYHFFALLFCVCPSLRMCARVPEMGQRLWLPGLGWRQANKRLRKRLEHHFSVPMIAIALLIMPVLIIEFFMKTQVAQYAWLRMLLHISTGVIWFAFAAEFILMVSVADKKISYCKSHWLDLAIILLPLLSFLRSLRVLRATRALRIPQLTKTARVYRLRGTAVKALRALILLEFFQRVTGGNVDRSIEKLQRQLQEVEAEAKEIRRKIASLERNRREQESASGPEPIVEPAGDNVSST